MVTEEWKGERVLHEPSQTSVVSSLLYYRSAIYYRNSIPDCTQKWTWKNIQTKKGERLVLYQNIIIEINTTYIKDTLNV